MKKLLVLAALLSVLFYVGATLYNDAHKDEPLQRSHPTTLQARATHQLGIMSSETADATDDPMGHCTGTAIGPHAILTAEHCNRGKSLQLDYSLKTYHIVKILKDHRDHVIYLVDGPAFYEIAPYKTRVAVVGEKVYIYGCGGNYYPCRYKSGVVTDEYDPSELDAADGMMYSSIKGIPGDSGSAVWAKDGSIVSLLSYGGAQPVNIGERAFIGAFALDFTPEQIKEAQSSNVPKETQKHVHPTVRPHPDNPFVIVVPN